MKVPGYYVRLQITFKASRKLLRFLYMQLWLLYPSLVGFPKPGILMSQYFLLCFKFPMWSKSYLFPVRSMFNKERNSRPCSLLSFLPDCRPFYNSIRSLFKRSGRQTHLGSCPIVHQTVVLFTSEVSHAPSVCKQKWNSVACYGLHCPITLQRVINSSPFVVQASDRTFEALSFKYTTTVGNFTTQYCRDFRSFREYIDCALKYSFLLIPWFADTAMQRL